MQRPVRTMVMIYLDECGYTGEDLLNKSQPVFVICTHSLTEQEGYRSRRRRAPALLAPS